MGQSIRHSKKFYYYLVRVPISSIDATMLIVELHSTGNGLGQGEAAGGGLGPVEFLPDWLSHILGNQGVLGLDLWEWIRHV